MNRAFPIILSAPSGGGKTTIARELLACRDDIGYSVSATTRPQRPGEAHGVDYFFLTPDDFSERVERGEFAEWAHVHGNRYGTLRSEVDRVLAAGLNVVMDIDVQGAAQFTEAFPDSVLVFLLPPSAGTLVSRLAGRRTEGADAMRVRLTTAMRELDAVPLYHYVVVNDDLKAAVARVAAIVDAERSRRDRAIGLDGRVAQLLTDLNDEVATSPLARTEP